MLRKTVLCGLITLLFLIWLYTSSLIGVDAKAVAFYEQLKIALRAEDYQAQIFGRRWEWDNWVLTKLSGATSKSKHLQGLAIDVIILDVNEDGKIDKKDVDIAHQILDEVNS